MKILYYIICKILHHHNFVSYWKNQFGSGLRCKCGTKININGYFNKKN
jgi:hypothetical protein